MLRLTSQPAEDVNGTPDYTLKAANTARAALGLVLVAVRETAQEEPGADLQPWDDLDTHGRQGVL